MSAICGIVRFDGQAVDKSELETMVESSPYWGLASKLDVSLGREQSSLQQGEVDRGPYSDGKLILEAYQRWGEDCVEHLLGDFVFALWEASNAELYFIQTLWPDFDSGSPGEAVAAFQA